MVGMDIRDFLRYFYKKKWIIAALTITGIVLSGAFTLISKPVYRQTRVLLIGPQPTVSKDGKFVTNLSFVIADLAQNDDVDEMIAQAAGSSKDAVKGMIAAKADDQHQKVEITVTGGSSELVSAVSSNAVPALIDTSRKMFNVENLVVVSEDKVPYVINKDYKKGIISGTVTGLGLGIMAVFILLLFDDRLKGRKEIKNLFGLDYLGSAVNREGLSELSARLLLRVKNNSSKILACVNLIKSGDKNPVYDIAGYIAGLGKKVLVIDLDKSLSHLPEKLKGNGKLGLSDILQDKNADIKQAVYGTEMDSLDVIPYGTRENISLGLLIDGSLTNIISSISGEYDIVMFNIPMDTGIDRMLLMLNSCDGVVLSVEDDCIGISDVERITTEFRDTGVYALGYYTV